MTPSQNYGSTMLHPTVLCDIVAKSGRRIAKIGRSFEHLTIPNASSRLFRSCIRARGRAAGGGGGGGEGRGRRGATSSWNVSSLHVLTVFVII